MATVILKEFPEDLHRKIKSVAAMRGLTMKQFIIDVMTEAVRPKRRAKK